MMLYAVAAFSKRNCIASYIIHNKIGAGIHPREFPVPFFPHDGSSRFIDGFLLRFGLSEKPSRKPIGDVRFESTRSMSQRILPSKDLGSIASSLTWRYLD